VLGQRGKLKKFEAELQDADFAKMLMALRLGLILCHARKDPSYENLQISCDNHKQRVSLTAHESWLADFPQSAHLLKQESTAWSKAEWTFEFMTKP
jgi:exopolyphosphatase/guanosine-5'-triphosphate,3'-diphosphate pyrophosphatase